MVIKFNNTGVQASRCKISFIAFSLLCATLILSGKITAQTVSRPATPPPAATQQRTATFDLNEYGVQVTSDARLLAVMGALDAAGFEIAPKEAPASPFIQELRRANATLDESLRSRLRNFYERNRLPAPATLAQQAARYISLAFALGTAPGFESPARTDDLPGGVLEVLDFAPLAREYYAKANLAERLPAYTQESQASGDRLRPGIAEMLRTVLNRFRVRPMLTVSERVPVEVPTAKNKKDKRPAFAVRERARRFQILPDPLAVPGTINLRVVGDDYFVVLPANANPASSELRRAYIQFLVDPLVRRFNREIALRRPDLIGLLTPAAATPAASAPTTTPRTTSVFEAVTLSLAAAVDARITESLRVAALTGGAAQASDKTKLAGMRREISDARIAQLADAYERGGVLAFYFAEQLDGIEASGFDATNLLPDLISTFDAAREGRRLTEAADARARDLERRRAAELAATKSQVEEVEIENPKRRALVRGLEEAETLLRANNYPEAETRLRALLAEHGGDARIFFALGQAASLGAEDAIDESVQAERLKGALAHYRSSIIAAVPETDKALLSRAHTAIGRIQLFLEQPTEAAAAFEAALRIGDVGGESYRVAAAELAKLRQAKP